MKKIPTEFSLQEEAFEITLDVDNSTITAAELINYLSNFESLFKSINETLNLQYAAGADMVYLDVIALEKGSFKIPIVVKKLAKSPYVLSVFTLVAGKLITGQPIGETFDSNNDPIEIKNEVFCDNKKTVNAISNIARITVESESIKSLSVTYNKPDGNSEKITMNKEQLGSLVTQDEESLYKLETHTMRKVKLIIFSPVLENEMVNWRFILDGRIISAKMMDQDFLNLLDNNPIAFGKGDGMVVDLVTEIDKRDESHPRVRHFISKVYSYPKYKNVQRSFLE